MEEYKLIKNFENYSISNLGNIKINNTKKILKQSNNIHGYKKVYLNGKNLGVHRLIAETLHHLMTQNILNDFVSHLQILSPAIYWIFYPN